MVDTNYKFPVEMKPVYTLDNALRHVEIPKKMAVVRTDSEKAIGVVSTQYKLLKHEDVLKGFEKALIATQHDMKIEMAKDGAQMFAKYTLKNVEVEARPGDRVKMQLIVKNSYDGTNALQMMVGAYRLVCTNGMIIGRTFMNFSQKHIGAGAEVNVKHIQDKLGVCIEQFLRSQKVMERMTEYQIGSMAPLSIEGFDAKKVKLPEYLLNAASEEYHKANDPTLWGYYNSLTYAISHAMRKESAVAAIRYGKVAWSVVQRELQGATV